MAIYRFLPKLIFGDMQDSFQLSLYRQIIFAIPVFVSVIVLRKLWIYRPNPKMLKAGWKAAAAIIIIIILNAIRCFAAPIEVDGITFLMFAIQVFLVGYCEEVLFRGLLFNAFHKKFGVRSLAGTRLAVVLSGIIFGATHLLNATNPSVSFTSAVIQAGSAAFMGIFLGAVYIRCGRGLWYVVFLHALNDAVAFIASGRLGGNSAAEIVNTIGIQAGFAQVVFAAVLFGGLSIFVLRKKKLEPCLAKLS